MDALFLEEENFYEIVPHIIECIIAYEKINKNCSEVEDSKLTSDIKTLLKKTHLDITQIQMHLEKCDYTKEKIFFFINIVKQHQTQLMMRSVTEHNSMYGDTLIDENWQLKLILGTSENIDAVFPVLNLETQTVSAAGNGCKKELKKYEFTEADLAKLVGALEASLKQ